MPCFLQQPMSEDDFKNKGFRTPQNTARSVTAWMPARHPGKQHHAQNTQTQQHAADRQSNRSAQGWPQPVLAQQTIPDRDRYHHGTHQNTAKNKRAVLTFKQR
ncbi:MAG: hypothetical protein C0620_08635 [Desulfuromonas sp.]|nr:MAG: hypothetical protein C0620_08635 [Desulfuromonas sp.]